MYVLFRQPAELVFFIWKIFKIGVINFYSFFLVAPRVFKWFSKKKLFAFHIQKKGKTYTIYPIFHNLFLVNNACVFMSPDVLPDLSFRKPKTVACSLNDSQCWSNDASCTWRAYATIIAWCTVSGFLKHIWVYSILRVFLVSTFANFQFQIFLRYKVWSWSSGTQIKLKFDEIIHANYAAWRHMCHAHCNTTLLRQRICRKQYEQNERSLVDL